MPRKVQPAALTLNFGIQGGSNQYERFYIDMSAVISAVNRRFYRQGLQWAVANLQFTNLSTLTTEPTVQVETLPQIWPMYNGWEKARQMKWNQDKLVLEQEESVKPKFYDFKIFGDTQHYVDFQGDSGEGDGGFQTGVVGLHTETLVPFSYLKLGSGVELVSMGDWDYSKIVIPNSGGAGVTEEFSLVMIGAGSPGPDGTKPIISGYADSRSVPQSPDPATQSGLFGWMTDLFDEGDNLDEVKQNLYDDQTELPYDQLNYPGEPGNLSGWTIDRFLQFTSTTISNTISSGPFSAPCGLIRIETDDLSDGESLLVTMNLVPGDHRGYLAKPMQEF